MKTYEKTCLHCLQPFTAKREVARYCTVNCRNAAHQLRKAGPPSTLSWEKAKRIAAKYQRLEAVWRAKADALRKENAAAPAP